MATDALKKAIRKYDKEHTKQILLKLNKRTDADILYKLDTVDNKQGYIKNLIRDDIKHGDTSNSDEMKGEDDYGKEESRTDESVCSTETE